MVPLGSKLLLEEVGEQGLTLRSYNLALLLVHVLLPKWEHRVTCQLPIVLYVSHWDELYPYGTVNQSGHGIYSDSVFLFCICVHIMWTVHIIPQSYIYGCCITTPHNWLPLYHIGPGIELRSSCLMSSTSTC